MKKVCLMVERVENGVYKVETITMTEKEFEKMIEEEKDVRQG